MKEPLNPALFLWNIYESKYLANESVAKFNKPSENILFPDFTNWFMWDYNSFSIENIGICNFNKVGRFTFHPLEESLSIDDLVSHMKNKVFKQDEEGFLFKNGVYINIKKGLVKNYLNLGDVYFVYDIYKNV